jgi:hypothetical protein
MLIVPGTLVFVVGTGPLILNRQGRASGVRNLVHFDKKRKVHVMAQQLEALVAEKIVDIPAGSRGEILGAKYLVALVKQVPAKMRPEKARATSD